MLSNEMLKGQDFHDFLSKSLIIDRKDRASAKDLLLHPFMTGCHGKVLNLINVQRIYTCDEIKFLTKSLLALIPEIADHRYRKIYSTLDIKDFFNSQLF